MSDNINNNAAWELNGVPRHIAIILDGNGLWAKKRGLPRTAGHAVGAETFRKTLRQLMTYGIGENVAKTLRVRIGNQNYTV